jgi:cation-transporting ATPase 13A2
MPQSERDLQKLRFGKCEVEVPRVSILSILFNEILNPFYIFQVFAIALFFWEEYTAYACIILGLSTASIIITIYDTVTNNN